MKERNPWALALAEWSVWRRALKLGLPVGLLQATLNQGDFWMRHAVDSTVLAKTILTPCVAFSVALSATAATYVERIKQEKAGPPLE